jgi:Na+(H+)/acetate symporter ActP
VVTVTEDAEHQAKRLKEDAEHEAQRLQKDKQNEAEWLAQHVTQDPELQQEWIRQENLSYGGLIAIGIVLVQPFVAGASLDTSGMICAVAFAIAIPLLAALVLVNQQETFRRRRTNSRIVAVARATAQASAFVGVVAGFWHIHWIASVGVLVSALVAVGVQSAGITRLELGERPASGPRKRPRSPRSPTTPTRNSAPRR